VVKFENDIINCSKELSEELSSIHVSTPPYERYQDSQLVSYSLLFQACNKRHVFVMFIRPV
jgi:hypothetical protein